MPKFDVYNKTALFVGVLIALLSLLFLILLFEFASNPFTKFAFTNLVLPVTAIVLTGIYFRALRRDLPLSFATLMRMGMLIILIGIPLFMGLYYMYIEMNEVAFFEAFRSESKEMMMASEFAKQGDLKGEKLEKALKELHELTTWDIVFKDFSRKLFLSIPAMLFTAIILRK